MARKSYVTGSAGREHAVGAGRCGNTLADVQNLSAVDRTLASYPRQFEHATCTGGRGQGIPGHDDVVRMNWRLSLTAALKVWL